MAKLYRAKTRLWEKAQSRDKDTGRVRRTFVEAGEIVDLSGYTDAQITMLVELGRVEPVTESEAGIGESHSAGL